MALKISQSFKLKNYEKFCNFSSYILSSLLFPLNS